ncbi:MAG TPA: hypothetical protein H9754_00785 [Candidatus Anaerostipes avistercoris]|uniref:Uncharacterized protein n=1 Tax=Candidatus Anaerostipes avistercoris TaxID=2838462 RepID=A0A9D2T8M0_9FIRM|nr:hypothetical protein [Candidatus Anaerostipes avistercoris]
MYKVIKRFHDLQDARKTKSGRIYHEYNVGDVFPRDGMEVSEERIQELAGPDNRQGVPLIELVQEKGAPKKTTKKTASGKTTTKQTTTKTASK